jgi:hypothetical protein
MPYAGKARLQCVLSHHFSQRYSHRHTYPRLRLPIPFHTLDASLPTTSNHALKTPNLGLSHCELELCTAWRAIQLDWTGRIFPFPHAKCSLQHRYATPRLETQLKRSTLTPNRSTQATSHHNAYTYLPQTLPEFDKPFLKAAAFLAPPARTINSSSNVLHTQPQGVPITEFECHHHSALMPSSVSALILILILTVILFPSCPP